MQEKTEHVELCVEHVRAARGLPLIGGILGHRQASTTQRYAHLADGPLRTAADLIGSELAAALDGASLRSRANSETVTAGS